MDDELAVGRHGREGGVGVVGIGHADAVDHEIVLVHVDRERADGEGPDAVFPFGERDVPPDAHHGGHRAREGDGLRFRGPEPEYDGMVVIHLR